MQRSQTSLFLAATLALAAWSVGCPYSRASPPDGTTLATNGPAQEVEARLLDQRAEQMRTNCINGSRHICGKVVQIFPEGLVVDSGYSALAGPQFNKSWRVAGTASVTRDSTLVEANRPGAPCVGLVFLTDIPKRPSMKLYDFVTILGYPAGQYTYTPLPGIKKIIRKFAARLPTAVHFDLQAQSK